MKKRNSFQILIFLDINVKLNSKNGISTDVYYQDTNTQNYLPYDSAHPESCKKNVPDNLAKQSIVFVTDSEKVKLRLNELRTWLKNNKYPDHITSSAFYNAKIQGPVPIPSVATFHEDTGNKIIMTNIKRKTENPPSGYLKGSFQESNIYLSQ